MPPSDRPQPQRGWLACLGPGILVAATGVGAGDLATAAFAGSKLGPAITWAVIIGALFKFILNEQLARFQIASRKTVLEGMATHLGRAVHAAFGIYLIAWTWFVCAAIATACGVTLVSILNLPDIDPFTPRKVLATLCVIIGFITIWIGGFKLFERIMALCISAMFFLTITTAILLAADIPALLKGIAIPTIPPPRDPDQTASPLSWILALIGGVGGTLTLICYAYWMRERNLDHPSQLKAIRIDLAIAYTLTAVFGLAMISIASTIDITTTGSTNIIIQLADRLAEPLGQPGNRPEMQTVRRCWVERGALEQR